MSKIKIRFIDWTRTGKTGGVGIYGLPANEGDSGEYQIGDELEVSEVPAGWASRVEIISGVPKAGAELIANPASESDAPRRGRPAKSGD